MGNNLQYNFYITMNNKIVSTVLIIGIAGTAFAGATSADTSERGFLFKGNSEIKTLIEKVRSGEELTADEQATLDTLKAERLERKDGKRGFKGFGKRAGFSKLTDEEKAELENMTDEERRAFFETKKEEMKAQKEARKNVIDKLIDGEALSSDEEVIRAEIAEKINNADGKRSDRPGFEAIRKLVNGETLTDEDRASLEEMQAKHAERAEKRAEMEAIKNKLEA